MRYDIEVENVSLYYKNVCALENINLQVKNGEFMGIIGPNGGGKTSLLKLILGLKNPSSGTVRIHKDRLGYVPQSSGVNKDFPIKVKDVILTGRIKKRLKPLHKYSKGDIEAVEKIMKKLGILSLKERQIGRLSGGQFQKVLMARALAAEPNILLLDEPTASIDAQSKNDIYELLKELNKKMTIVLVTHDLSVISCYVDTIVCLNKRLYYHGEASLKKDTIKKVFGCPVDLIAHGFPHRV